jgi:hypothetical protein
MVMRLHAVVFLATILAGGIASADVIVRVEMKDEKAEAPDKAPAKAPAAANNPPRADADIRIETLADARGKFLARTRVGKQVIELKGSLKQNGKDGYRAAVSFSDQTDGRGQHQVSTNVELPLDKPHLIGKMLGDTVNRSILLTITNDEPAK